MVYIHRILDLDLPPRQSAFLWGPRKSGKSTLLKQRFPNSLVFDFLKTDLFLEFAKRPSLLREQILAKDDSSLRYPIILDEVQKIPQILDEVHWLIENKGLSFILCGSSARKMKRGGANLLGGRAWKYELFPLVFAELEDVDLLKALNRGLIPDHYFQDQYRKSLRAYTADYLKEEIFNEGLARNIPAFSRFLDAIAYSHGELVNFSNISRDCGVNSKVVREYYYILVDTLMGYFIEPFKKHQSRQVITSTPKFYLFDTGVAGILTKREIIEEKGILFGKAFEHFILMELMAYKAYNDLDFDISFWRTKAGAEVDFVLEDAEVAIEVKGSSRVDHKNLRSILNFHKEFKPRKSIVVCNEAAERMYGPVRISPYKLFLSELWSGNIIS
jgi:predicted AAA+ superfamily ATPase